MTNRKAVDRRDAIRSELKQIGKQMGGINPKLSIYQTLQKRQDTLNQELQALRI